MRPTIITEDFSMYRIPLTVSITLALGLGAAASGVYAQQDQSRERMRQMEQCEGEACAEMRAQHQKMQKMHEGERGGKREAGENAGHGQMHKGEGGMQHGPEHGQMHKGKGGMQHDHEHGSEMGQQMKMSGEKKGHHKEKMNKDGQ
jgi:hypothetical protein